MIRMIRNNSPLAIILCMLMVTLLVGCGDDTDDVDIDDVEDENVSEAPPLPPDNSMMIDLSTFDEEVQAAPGDPAPATYRNFGNAVVRVSTISAGLVAAASVPAAVFAAAVLYPPIPQGDNTWIWSYSVTVEYVTFTAILTGIKRGGNVTDWSMVVSTNAPLRPVQEFLWYTGTSNGTDLEGSWQFYDIATPTEQNPTVTIDWWASEEDAGQAELTIENVDSRAENEYIGDTLDYDLVGEGTCSLSYTDVSENEVWEIIWDSDTGEGSLRVPDYNGGEKACWNALKQDVDCN